MKRLQSTMQTTVKEKRNPSYVNHPIYVRFSAVMAVPLSADTKKKSSATETTVNVASHSKTSCNIPQPDLHHHPTTFSGIDFCELKTDLKSY